MRVDEGLSTHVQSRPLTALGGQFPRGWAIRGCLGPLDRRGERVAARDLVRPLTTPEGEFPRYSPRYLPHGRGGGLALRGKGDGGGLGGRGGRVAGLGL